MTDFMLLLFVLFNVNLYICLISLSSATSGQYHKQYQHTQQLIRHKRDHDHATTADQAHGGVAHLLLSRPSKTPSSFITSSVASHVIGGLSRRAMEFASNFPPRDDKMDDLFYNQDNSVGVGIGEKEASGSSGQDNDNYNASGSGRLKVGSINKLPFSSDYSKSANLQQLDNTIEEPEMFANNHQSSSYTSTESITPTTTTSSSSSITNNNNNNNNNGVGVGGHNSRYYNNYLLLGSNANSLSADSNYNQHHKYNKYNKYNHYSHYGKYAPNMFANNYNLNYIHSFLTSKPAPAIASTHSLSSPQASSLQTMQSLLNSNPNGLTLTAAYGSASSPPQQQQQQQQQVFGSSSSATGGSISAQSAAAALTAAAAAANNLQQTMARGQHQLAASKNGTTHGRDIEAQQAQLAQHNNSTSTPIDADHSGYSSQCGRQQVAYREPRIVGGNSTYEGEFPWAVSIQRHGHHHCGGVIVGRRWILTAAHCVRSQLVGNIIVRSGGHTLTRSINSLNGHLEKDFSVEQIIMHDDFSRYDNLTASQMKSSANTNNADIALLRLRQEIHWNEFAWPVCFPDREGGNFSGHDAIAVGWGKLNEKSEEFSNELQKVKLTIIDNKVCQNWFRQAGRDMPIDDRIICAGFKNGGKDACHGDSGGPLLSRLNGQYVVVGVVSTGIGCARPLLPGLYSRVSSYIGWIERHINN